MLNAVAPTFGANGVGDGLAELGEFEGVADSDVAALPLDDPHPARSGARRMAPATAARYLDMRARLRLAAGDPPPFMAFPSRAVPMLAPQDAVARVKYKRSTPPTTSRPSMMSRGCPRNSFDDPSAVSQALGVIAQLAEHE